MSVVPIEETLKYMNQARTKPSQFAKYVKKQLDTFINPTTLPLRPGCNYQTNEGNGAWKEAYDFLLKQKPLPAMELNKGLTLAAEDHAIDMANTGIFGHNSSNGMSFSKRIEKRCGQAFGSSGQNIGSDFKVAGRNHALQTITGLIIDDGVSDRGHRTNIFSASFKYVGISSRIQGDKIITVMDFHSNNLGLQNGSQNNNNTGMNLSYQQPKQQFSGSSDLSNNGWGNMKFNQGGSNSGGRTILSQSTSTKTSTINGKTTTIKTTKTTYSDGSIEQATQETIK